MSEKSFIQRVSEYKAAIHALGLKKTGKNRSFMYFDMVDFIPQAMELAPKYGLLTLSNIGKENSVLRVFDAESDKDLTVIVPTVEANVGSVQAIQNLGSTITYMRRYLWITFLDMAEHDPIDGGDYDEDPKSKPKPEKKELPTEPKPAPAPKAEAQAPKNEAPVDNTANYRIHFQKQMAKTGAVGKINAYIKQKYGKEPTALTVTEMKQVIAEVALQLPDKGLEV